MALFAQVSHRANSAGGSPPAGTTSRWSPRRWMTMLGLVAVTIFATGGAIGAQAAVSVSSSGYQPRQFVDLDLMLLASVPATHASVITTTTSTTPTTVPTPTTTSTTTTPTTAPPAVLASTPVAPAAPAPAP